MNQLWIWKKRLIVGPKSKKAKKNTMHSDISRQAKDFRLEAGGAEVYAEIRPPATSWPLIFPIILAL